MVKEILLKPLKYQPAADRILTAIHRMHMAVLGVIKGFSGLPPEMQEGVKAIGDSTFIHTTYSFNSAVSQYI